jgi:hypothetical protein
MPQRATTPPFGPTGDGTVYLVMDCEADLQRMVADLLSDQYRSPLRVVAFDTSDSSLCDITAGVAREVLACAVESGSCCQPRCAISWGGRLRDFVGLGRLCLRNVRRATAGLCQGSVVPPRYVRPGDDPSHLRHGISLA